MKTGRPDNWTVERVTRLRALHRIGLSHTQIGAELGVSRAGVGAKLNRLGLTSRPRTQTFVNAVTVAPDREKRKFDRPVAEPAREGAPTPLLIPLVELRHGQCRWPIGDPGQPGFGFCGHPRLAERPYCEFHVGIAYHKVEPRRAMAA